MVYGDFVHRGDKMRRIGILSLVIMLLLTMMACNVSTEDNNLSGSDATDTSNSAEEQLSTSESMGQQVPDGTICLTEALSESSIEIILDDNTIQLLEDDLVFTLSTESVLCRRDGYIVAVMHTFPVLIDGKVYVDEDFFKSFLQGNHEQPSLFHGTWFFAGEILTALDQPEGSAFNQKLLQEVLLPTSMGVTVPRIDLLRVFQSNTLDNYPDSLKGELAVLGYENAGSFTYTEYEILSGGQTLAQANMGFVQNSYPELKNVSMDEMTVAQFRSWQRDQTKQNAINALAETDIAFMEEKQINADDYLCLIRDCFEAPALQSDSAIYSALEGIYQADLDYVKSMVDVP